MLAHVSKDVTLLDHSSTYSLITTSFINQLINVPIVAHAFTVNGHVTRTSTRTRTHSQWSRYAHAQANHRQWSRDAHKHTRTHSRGNGARTLMFQTFNH